MFNPSEKNIYPGQREATEFETADLVGWVGYDGGYVHRPD